VFRLGAAIVALLARSLGRFASSFGVLSEIFFLILRVIVHSFWIVGHSVKRSLRRLLT
jgi:hypothetical protein